MDLCDKYLGLTDCPYHHNQQRRFSLNPTTSHVVVKHHLDVPGAELNDRDNCIKLKDKDNRIKLHDRDNRIIYWFNYVDIGGNRADRPRQRRAHHGDVLHNNCRDRDLLPSNCDRLPRHSTCHHVRHSNHVNCYPCAHSR